MGAAFGILGAVEARNVEGVLIRLPRRQERCLLAVLLLERGREVSADRLAALLWDGEPPEGARRAVQTLISRLRGLLRQVDPDGSVRLESRRTGYLLTVPAAAVDVHQFRSLVEQARAAPGEADRVALLRTA